MAQKQLSDIIEIIGGGTPATSNCDFWNGDIPWLSVVDFNTSQKYVSKTEKTITQKGLSNSSAKLLQKGDIIISARGTVGAIAILTKPMAFNQSCYGVRGKENESYTDYIYYFIKSKLYELKQFSHGGVFDTITKETLENIEIDLPCIAQQKAIAAVLSSLDDKIDLLHRQNATLERMAETLFRQWFIEEAQEEWEEVSLSSLVSIIGGGTPKTKNKSYWNGDILWLSGGDITSSNKTFLFNTTKKISSEGLEKSSAKMLPPFSTVITARGTVGNICILGKEATFSQTNYGIIPKRGNTPFFTFLITNYMIETLKQSAYGSVFDTITRKNFDEITIDCPDDDYIINFEKSITPLFSKIFSNCHQIQTLEKLRDTLLPKLLSGEVRVQVDE